MAEGLLEVKGTIDIDQFWPVGTSDADTSKIKVEVDADSFRYRPHTGAAFKVTRAFRNATVRGKTTKDAIDANSRITVRLQGIDAPELHYRPAAAVKKPDQTKQQRELYLKWNLEFRQALAESSTVAVTKLLGKFGGAAIPCVVRSYVDHPNDVFDTYGRFVGDIFVKKAGSETSVNLWAIKNGWALPAFYNSMSVAEITTIIDAANSAYAAKRGVWPTLLDAVGTLDFKLEFRGKGAPIEDDSGDVLVPKMFRRLAEHAVNRRAKMVSDRFHAFLESKGDVCFLTEDFLEQGPAAEPRQLSEFVAKNGTMTFWPEDLVFKDSPSRLTGPGGAEVDW